MSLPPSHHPEKELAAPGPAHEAYFRALPREDVQLLALREVLYDGSWDELIKDLQARKEGKPYVYKLQLRIEEDLDRIERLRAYEVEHGVSLGKLVDVDALAQERGPAR
jgi:hypothetical protein